MTGTRRNKSLRARALVTSELVASNDTRETVGEINIRRRLREVDYLIGFSSTWSKGPQR